MTEPAVSVRPFERRDRAAVREICCDTADRGEPVERFFPDRELIADLVTGYYTDREPQSTWVAEAGGRVVGYLTGSLDSARCERETGRAVAPRAVLRAVGRGVLWHRATWRLLRAFWMTWRAGGWPRRSPFEEYPAHVHINVRAECRGRRVGHRLAERFFQQMEQAGLKGVHAHVRGDNASGRRFFERLGFVAVSEYPLVVPARSGYLQTQTVLYGKRM